jgi:toxin ParE1/3/4
MQHLHDYIAEDNPKAAKKIISRIAEAADKLKIYPHMGKAGRVATTRELVIAATPYIIVYIIDNETIQIVSVIHGARLWPDSL